PERFWGDAPGLRALAGCFERLPGTRRGQFGDTHAAQVDLGVAHRAERARFQVLADARDQPDGLARAERRRHTPRRLRPSTAQHAHLRLAFGEDDIVDDDAECNVLDHALLAL